MRKRVAMTNVKIGFAFVLGWFCCGLLTPHLLSPTISLDLPSTMISLRSTSTSNATSTPCDGDGINHSKSPALSSFTLQSSGKGARFEATLEPDKTDPTGGLGGGGSGSGLLSAEQTQNAPKISSRCEFMWDAAARCKRPPFKAFDTSRRANNSCLSKLDRVLPPSRNGGGGGGGGGGPPPVVVIAALPRSGSSLLRTALEYATGVRCVGLAAEGQCSAKQFAFVETPYPYRKPPPPPPSPPADGKADGSTAGTTTASSSSSSSVSSGSSSSSSSSSSLAAGSKHCAFWLNKNVRSKPLVARVWGVVVVVRHPYKWLDDLFGARLEYSKNEVKASSNKAAHQQQHQQQQEVRRRLEVTSPGEVPAAQGLPVSLNGSSSNSGNAGGGALTSSRRPLQQQPWGGGEKAEEKGFASDAKEEEEGAEEGWDSFLVRHSHTWRSFVEHWLLAERGALWETRLLELDARLFEEGPRHADIGGGGSGDSGSGPEQASNRTTAAAAAATNPSPRYFILRYETLIKDPKEAALSILEWSKEAIVVDGSERTQQRLIERAERCVNYGNVVGRMAKTHRQTHDPQASGGLSPRFKVGEAEHVASKQWERREAVFVHAAPYLCAFKGYKLPKELAHRCPTPP